MLDLLRRKRLVTVIIPTRNKAPRLHLTLACLSAQQVDREWEVVVVNDGSTDATESVIKAMKSDLPLRSIDGPQRGRGAARNAGVAAAVGDVLIFLDDDVLTSPSFVQTHADHQRQAPGLAHGKLRELIGAAKVHDPQHGGPGFPPLHPDRICREGLFPDGMRVSPNALERAIERLYATTAPAIVPWLASVGANLSSSRDAWEVLGGFDESFGTSWGCEDLEFGFRAHQKGVPLAFLPEAFGIHMTHHNPDRWAEHQVNLQRFRELHPVPDVDRLALLLSFDGSAEEYLSAQGNQ